MLYQRKAQKQKEILSLNIIKIVSRGVLFGCSSLLCFIFCKLVMSVATRISWPLPQMCTLLHDRSEEIIPDGLYNLLLWTIDGYDLDNEDPVPLHVKYKAQFPNVHCPVNVAHSIICSWQ